MGRVPKPSPALVVAIISLVVAIGGTAAALPGKFTVGRDDLKPNSVGARSLGKAILDYGTTIRSTDSIAGDGLFTEFEGRIACPAKAPFAFDPSVGGLTQDSSIVSRLTFANRWGGPGSFRFVLRSDEGPDVFHVLKVNCLPSR